MNPAISLRLTTGHCGWTNNEYLDATGVRYEPGSTMATSAVLNLRQMPSTESKVLLVMPKDVKVTVGGQ